MSTEPVRVAVLGGGMFFEEIIGQTLKDFTLGGIAGALNSIGMSRLAPEVAGIPVHLVAVCTNSPGHGTADRIAADFNRQVPGASVTAHYGQEGWQEILKTTEPEVLFVAVPDHLHAPAILQALAHGVHVIAEKPLCLHTAEADRIIAEAEERGLVVAVDMHKRYDPFVRELMTRSIRRYGEIVRIRAVLEEPLEVSTDVFAWAEESDPFAYVGCHWLDVVSHYTGAFPRAVYATGERKLLEHWDDVQREIAARTGRTDFKRTGRIHTWDSMNVNVTYDNGMRGDFNNTWINPADFEGAVNQEIEVIGTLGRGMVDQQDRGLREAITGEGSRTRNPAFGARVETPEGGVELFGYGKASIAAGLLAILRVLRLGASISDVEGTYPDAKSQRPVTMVIEAARSVAARNYEHFQGRGAAPVTAALTPDSIRLIDPFGDPIEHSIYCREPGR